MSIINQSLYDQKTQFDQKIQSTFRELVENGYNVLIKPEKSDLPFDLGGYCPDLIATKNGGGLVLEIKTSLKRLSIEQFQDIAERVASHSWRFILVTLDDTSAKILPLNNDLSSWEDLHARLANLNTLIQESLLEPALLFFWSILEAALRKRAIAQNIPVERFPIAKLLNHIYSSGEISISEFDLFKSSLEIRNRVAHGMFTFIDPEMLNLANNTIQSLIKQWSQENTQPLS